LAPKSRREREREREERKREREERERTNDYLGAIYVNGTGSHTYTARRSNEFGLRAVCVWRKDSPRGLEKKSPRTHAVENARGRLAKICMEGFLSHFAHGLVLYSRAHVRSLKQNLSANFFFAF